MELCDSCLRIVRIYERFPRFISAFSKWIGRHGNIEYLCYEHTNIWLDNADDDEDLEPRELVWL